MIEKQIDVPAPALIDDEYLADRGVGSQATGVLSRLGMFIYSSPLMELLEEILERFYRHSSLSQNRSSFPETTDIVTPVLVINRKLDDFAETVPDYLRVSNNSSTPGRNEDHILLQQQVLHNRFVCFSTIAHCRGSHDQPDSSSFACYRSGPSCWQQRSEAPDH